MIGNTDARRTVDLARFLRLFPHHDQHYNRAQTGQRYLSFLIVGRPTLVAFCATGGARLSVNCHFERCWNASDGESRSLLWVRARLQPCRTRSDPLSFRAVRSRASGENARGICFSPALTTFPASPPAPTSALWLTATLRPATSLPASPTRRYSGTSR